MHRDCRSRGFTLIELMVTVAVVAVLAMVAYPAYNQYTLRARIVPGIDALTALATRLEQRFQDVGGYGAGPTGQLDGDCGVVLQAPANFALTCAAAGTGSPGGPGSTYTATATGLGPATGVTYTINDAGVRRTLAHPRGVPTTDCWSIRGATCDS